MIVCDSDDEMLREADRIASEHVQVMTPRPTGSCANMHELRRAVPRSAHQRRLWRQGDRHQPHAADQEGGALHRRPVGRQVPEDLHLSAVTTDEAAAMIGEYGSRLCMLEGLSATPNRQCPRAPLWRPQRPLRSSSGVIAMVPTIVPVYAAVFAIMLVALSVRVANTRREARVALGDGGKKLLQRRIRARATSPNTYRWR